MQDYERMIFINTPASSLILFLSSPRRNGTSIINKIPKIQLGQNVIMYDSNTLKMFKMHVTTSDTANNVFSNVLHRFSISVANSEYAIIKIKLGKNIAGQGLAASPVIFASKNKDCAQMVVIIRLIPKLYTNIGSNILLVL
jgi:hypothetical protein